MPLALLLVAVGLAPGIAAAQTASPAAGAPLPRAVAWLQRKQNTDGGFGAPGKSDAGTTAEAVLALAAARHAGIAVDLDGALRYLDTQALVFTQRGVGQAAELALAEIAAGRDPDDVAKVSPLQIAEHGLSHGTDLAGSGVFDHALAMLAVAAAKQPVPEGAAQALAATQLGDGSWAYDGSTQPGKGDSNTTALAIEALVASGRAKDPMVAHGLAYLKTVQATDGAFGYQVEKPLVPDANSTAFAVQAIIATGGDPAAAGWHDAAAALAAFQNPSGALHYTAAQPDDNLFATIQGIPALAGLPLPIVPAAGAAFPGARLGAVGGNHLAHPAAEPDR